MKTPNYENVWCNVKGKHTNHVAALTRDQISVCVINTGVKTKE